MASLRPERGLLAGPPASGEVPPAGSGGCSSRTGEARRWYTHLAKPHAADVEPTFESAFKAAKAAVPDKHAAQRVYDIAKEMDARGAHPSHEVLLQTLNQSGEHAKVGARYERQHCIVALDPGLVLTMARLGELSDDVSIPPEEWAARVEALWQERRTAMAPYHDELPPGVGTK